MKNMARATKENQLIIEYIYGTRRYTPIIKIAIINMILLLSFPSFIPYQEWITPVCFILLTLVPLIHNYILKEQLAVFDPIVMISMIYTTGGPLAILFRDYYEKARDLFYLSNAEVSLIWTYRGFSALLFGYFLTKICIKQIALNHSYSHDESMDLQVFTKGVGIISLIGMIATIIMHGGVPYTFIESGNTDGNSTISQFLSYMTKIRYGFFLLYFILLRSLRDKAIKRIFFATLFIHLLFVIGSGSKAFVLEFLVCVAVSTSIKKNRYKLKYLFISIIMIIIVYSTFSIINTYRTITRDTTVYSTTKTGIIDSITVQVDTFINAIDFVINRQTKHDSTNVIVSRFTYITSIAHVFNLSNYTSEYLHNIETLLIPLYAVLPRSIFTNKPEYMHSGHIATMSGMSYGGISVTLIGSLFLAWGYLGIYFGMLFIGILFANIHTRSTHTSLRGARNKVLLIILTIYLLDPGISFQVIATDLLRIWLFLYALCWLVPRLGVLRVHRTNQSLTQRNGCVER